MGLGLFRGINTIEEARDRVYTLVHKLKTSCLFLDCDIKSVKMHDVVLDVAISIASRDQNGFMVSYGVGLKEWPKDIQKKCTAISLPHSNIHELPQWLEYPELKFLFVHSNDPTLKIPDTFFQRDERT
ncbi:hypothetical protein L1049_020934 [Liquidambar formosana]|uniref:Uncharacterized protein n=1 Tax=Liquidambar formosana TaxID=63359 RepID=A0AAP0SDE9_LIQFO